MRLHPAIKNGEAEIVPLRSATLSTRIVAQVREALFAKELRGRLSRHGEGSRRALRRQPHRRTRRAAHARGAGHRPHQGWRRGRRAHRAGRYPSVRRGAGGAARSCRRLSGRDHGCAARHRVPSAELAALNSTAEDHRRLRALNAEAERRIGDLAAYTGSGAVPSGGRRGLAQPRAGGAAHFAAACLLADAQPDADAAGGAAHPGRTSSWRR